MALEKSKFPNTEVTPYDTLRPKLRNGDILLCSGNGLFSAMIQQATDSVWSHVAFIIRLDAIDRVMLLESVEPIGVRTVRLSKYLTGYADKKPYNGGMVVIRHRSFDGLVDAPGLTKLAQYAVDYFGYPYDKDEIVKIAARIMAAKVPFTAKQRKKIAPDEEFICSEYVARCYEQVGISVKWDKLGFIAPADFAEDPDIELVAVLKRR